MTPPPRPHREHFQSRTKLARATPSALDACSPFHREGRLAAASVRIRLVPNEELIEVHFS